MEPAHIFEMIQLLKKQVSYLKDFQKINLEEGKRIYQGNLTNLEAFYYDRELLLNAVERIDQKLKTKNIDHYEGVGNKEKSIVVQLLKEKRKSICEILNQDIEIHSLLSSNLAIDKTKIA